TTGLVSVDGCLRLHDRRAPNERLGNQESGTGRYRQSVSKGWNREWGKTRRIKKPLPPGHTDALPVVRNG
ncbi:Hypothetical predicted protein, partial [Marmota monax]